MIKEKGLIYTIKYYYLIHFFLVWYTLICFTPIFTAALGKLFDFKSGGFFYWSFLILIAFAVTVLSAGAFLIVYQQRRYRYLTGRNYFKDSTKYERSYKELVSYFQNADPLKLDISTLPAQSWKQSGGLIFGKKDNHLISYEPNKNGICAFIWGAPGDGKTTATIIPSCRQFGFRKNEFGALVQKGSVMVTDLKGDIYEANKRFRKIKRFSTINWQESAHYDPLSNARNMSSTKRATFLENLAITVIPNEASADAKYFIDGARDFFTGIFLYSLNKNNNASFTDIIEAIVTGNYIDWVTNIKNSDDTIAMAYTNHFYGENEKNVAGTYSKLVSCARLFTNDVLKILLTDNGNCISPTDLENCIDIYIQIDPNQLTLMGPLISMIYQSFLSVMLYRQIGQNPPIAFIIDEFGQIPAMPVIMQSAALLRAYNCSLMFSCQSLAMLDERYGEAGRKILMDCAKVNCFMSIYDPDTREWASRLIGNKKVLKISTQANSQNSNNALFQSSGSKSVIEASERIIEPQAFGNLPNEDAVFIYMNGKYIKAEKTYYFK